MFGQFWPLLFLLPLPLPQAGDECRCSAAVDADADGGGNNDDHDAHDGDAGAKVKIKGGVAAIDSTAKNRNQDDEVIKGENPVLYSGGVNDGGSVSSKIYHY